MENLGALKEIDIFVGKRLREKRQKLALTLAQVGEKLGVSHQQIQKYEQAQSRISASILFQIGQFYGVSSHYFFDGFQHQGKKSDSLNLGTISQDAVTVLNILLVEDDPADELLARRALESANIKINIFCVHDGVQALDFLRHGSVSIDFPRPDLVLLDLNIPKRDGHTVLKEIKRDREIQEIPVIILTNSISIQAMVNAYKNSASGFICKSFDYDHFEQSIAGLVNYWGSVVVLPSSAYSNMSSAF
ncbi:MAG: response regulator [Alphaproteobacteria bacterium]|nr:response regulator [Alphaproteobacteria bacterium]